ncbi:MAG: hypothetical protein A3F40_02255, partial [Chlamydiae bacterium RIFCSPHIGHO2_12_FULL_27_8]
MPIIWKYLLKEYLKVFFLSIFSFIFILLITRLKEIAGFATLSNNFLYTILFALYQIPHILPISISISCLISISLLFQKLSKMHELTALRSLGLSIKNILTPILLMSFVFSLLNFLIVSEIGPISRYKSKELFYKNTSMNPLVLLQRRQKMSNIKNSYVEISTKNNDRSADDLLIITFNKANKRLNLINAKNLKLDENFLIGKDISIISYLDSKEVNNFDNLAIENQLSFKTKASAISNMIKSNQWNMSSSAMCLKMLLLKIKDEKKILKNKKNVSAIIEIAKRTAFGLSSFSFAFIGASFGISISRSGSIKNIILAILSTLVILISFTLGKSLKYYPIFSIIA